MKFIELLDPSDLPNNDPSAVGEQQKRAGELFPSLVEASNLCYWKPGDTIQSEGVRYILGMAASFNTLDLKLADLLNQRLSELNDPLIQVDVFNILDITKIEDINLYFSDAPNVTLGWHCTPLVGKWVDGIQIHASAMESGRNFMLQELGCQ